MDDELSSDDKEKSIYLTQIRHLDEQLQKCQLRCDVLEKENNNFVSLNNALEEDKKDITEYLKYTDTELEKQVDHLTGLLEKQQEVEQEERELLKEKHSQEIQKLQEQIDKLNMEKRTLVASLEEQVEQKQHLTMLIKQLPSVDSVEKQLLHQQEEHEAAVQSLMVEAGREKAKILEMQNAEKKCVEAKISEMLHEVRAKTVKETEKIQKLTRETLELLKQKDELQDKESEMCFEEEELREKLKRVKLEMFTYEQEMEQLKDKYESLVDDVKNCKIKHEQALAEEDALRLYLASMSEECYEKTVEADHLRSELQVESSRRKQLESSVQKAAVTLRRILMDSDKLQVKKIQRLLDSLEISVPQAADSGSTEKSRQEQELQTSVPEPQRAETQDLAADPLFLMARYIPGDLGLVPRPTTKQKAASSGPSAHRVPVHRKTSSQADLPAQAPPQDEAAA